jgi:hypothetical protein
VQGGAGLVDNGCMEPYEAINSLEVALRGLIQDVLENQWIEKSGLEITTLEQRRTEEAARRKGAATENNLLTHAHIYELRKIIEKNWESFKPALIEKKRFDIYMDRVEDFRNAPMHSRELLPFERDLLSGIVGEIRNLVTIYRSEQAPDRRYYPVVESIVDSFGNEAEIDRFATTTNIRLRVGEGIEFACRGWDAQGRILSWRLLDQRMNLIDRAKGNSVTLKWAASASPVQEDCIIRIEMASSGKYHRLGNWDFHHILTYSVDPPQ